MSEEASTEVLEAFVRVDGDKYALEIQLGDEVAVIPLSQDQPNEVKSAFNKLVVQLKTGLFRVELQEPGEELFSQVSREYLKQLNSELKEVFGEMVSSGLSDAPQA